jgi:hypothetical protein
MGRRVAILVRRFDGRKPDQLGSYSRAFRAATKYADRAEGGTNFWGAKYDNRAEHFFRDSQHPSISVTQSGLLIAATEKKIEVYRALDGHLKLRNESDYSGERPLAILATGAADEFAVFEPNGRVRVFRVPG